MDRKEKKRLKNEIGKYIDLSNGRFTDDEVSRLYSLVEERDSYDGRTQTYRSSYKAFDSEDTYHVKDTDTYTFRSGDTGIRIEYEHISDWDDGQHDETHEVTKTARGILNLLGKLKIWVKFTNRHLSSYHGNSYQMSGNQISVKALDLNKNFSQIAA